MLSRFIDKVQVTDECWEWQGSKNSRGYGLFWFNGQSRLAHKYSYEFVKNSVPEGLELDHLCSNTSCVNPKHLEAVDHKTNVRRWSDSITHCKWGHEYTPENTGRLKGYRRCKKCNAISERHRRLKLKEL